MTRRVFLVDDHALFRAGVRAELEGFHEVVGEAGDVEEAVARILATQPEVVLLDLGLPEMDGYEVARKLRAATADKAILLIAVTGYQSDLARLKQTGFDQHLIKPPNIEKLSAMLVAWDADKGRPHA